jgi:hypothetical protein
MKSKFFFRLFAVFGILVMVMGLAPVGQTQVLANADNLPSQIITDPNCWGLDIIFLVSQSTMSNLNDLYQLRMQAVGSAIDLIGENALFFCPGYTHRISVMGFAQLPGKTPAGIYLDPTIETYIPIPGKAGSDLIRPSLNNLGGWEDTKNNLLKPALPIKDLGYYSNYLGAFNAAAAQFKTWSTQPIDNLPRRRAVIVIGEGGLCTADTACNNFPGVVNSLNKVLDPAGNTFPFKGLDNPQSVVIYFLGILARKHMAAQFFDDPVISSFWTNVTTSHGGALEILQRGQGDLETNLNTDLALKLGKVMNSLLGLRLSPNNCQPFWVNPYMSEFTILHFYRKNTAGQNGLTKVNVAVTGQKGKQVIGQYVGGQTKVGPGQVIDYSNPPNEAYVLYGTPPGFYSVQVQGGDYCADLDLEMGQTGILTKVLSPAANTRFPEVDAAPYYDQANPAAFRIQLLQPDLHGVVKPLRELSDYPLDVKVNIKSQIGSLNPVNVTLPLTRVDDANAIYETKDPILTRYPNVYSWAVTAATSNPRAFDPTIPVVSPVEIVRQEGVFTVGNMIRPFNFVIQNLAKTQELPLIDGALDKPLSVKVQIVNPDNTPFSNDFSIAPKGSLPFAATMTGPKGEVITKDLNTTDKNNTYSVDLPLSNNNPAAYEPGCYTIAVSLKDGFDKAVFVPARSQVDPVSVCLVTSQKFSWTLVSPTKGSEYPIHPQLSLNSPAAVLPIVIKAFDSSNHPLDASSLQTTDKPVFTGVISGPGIPKGVSFNFSQDKETGDFVADWPAVANVAGQFTLRVLLNADNLNIAYYTPINRIDPLLVTRSDDILAKPWVIPAIIIGVAALMLILLWAFVASRIARHRRAA